MKVCARALHARHAICIAHGLHLLVHKSFDQVPALIVIHTKARTLATYFRTSITGKERLDGVKVQMGRQTFKLITEEDTHWNSTYLMLERLGKMREPVGAALATLKTDISPLTSLLVPLHQATVEISDKKRVSASKIIPLMKLLHHAILAKSKLLNNNKARQLTYNLQQRVRVNVANIVSYPECNDNGHYAVPNIQKPWVPKLQQTRHKRQCDA